MTWPYRYTSFMHILWQCVTIYLHIMIIPVWVDVASPKAEEQNIIVIQMENKGCIFTLKCITL
jgi:hypothetical protein